VIGIVGELLALDEGEVGAVAAVIGEVEGHVDGDPGVPVAVHIGGEVVLGDRPAGRGVVIGVGQGGALHADGGQQDHHQT